jgi:hypothetical protein
MWEKNDFRADNPPADAPIPTTVGFLRELDVKSISVDCPTEKA